MYQSWDSSILIRFISHFWWKINKRGIAIRIYWCVFSKKKEKAAIGGNVSFGVDSTVFIWFGSMFSWTYNDNHNGDSSFD